MQFFEIPYIRKDSFVRFEDLRDLAYAELKVADLMIVATLRATSARILV